MSDERYTVVLEEARRALDQQRSDLAGVRDRASNLLGFAGLAGAFIGGLAVRDGAEISGWAWTAVVAFALLALSVDYVLKPRKFTLMLASPKLVGWIENDDATVDTLRRDTALWLDDHHTSNQKTLDSMYTAYLAGIALFLIEVCVLMIDLKDDDPWPPASRSLLRPRRCQTPARPKHMATHYSRHYLATRRKGPGGSGSSDSRQVTSSARGRPASPSTHPGRCRSLVC